MIPENTKVGKGVFATTRQIYKPMRQANDLQQANRKKHTKLARYCGRWARKGGHPIRGKAATYSD
jgi:hypothetical protein